MIRLIAIFALTIAPLSFAGPVVRSVAVRGTSLQVVLRTQVGQPYDARVIDQDVRRLWSTGRFDDIQVHTDEDGTGAAVIFDVVEAPELRLHLVRIEPPSFGPGLALPETALPRRGGARKKSLSKRGSSSRRRVTPTPAWTMT